MTKTKRIKHYWVHVVTEGTRGNTGMSRSGKPALEDSTQGVTGGNQDPHQAQKELTP